MVVVFLLLSPQTDQKIARNLMSWYWHAFNNILHPQRLDVRELEPDSNLLQLMNLYFSSDERKYSQIVRLIVLDPKRMRGFFLDSFHGLLLFFLKVLLLIVLPKPVFSFSHHLGPDLFWLFFVSRRSIKFFILFFVIVLLFTFWGKQFFLIMTGGRVVLNGSSSFSYFFHSIDFRLVANYLLSLLFIKVCDPFAKDFLSDFSSVYSSPEAVSGTS